jgi:hypothetical protein
MSVARLQEIERQIARLHPAQAEALVVVASSERVVDEYFVSTVDRDDERAIRIEDA